MKVWITAIILVVLVGCQPEDSHTMEIVKECEDYKLNLTFVKEGDWWTNTRCSQECLKEDCGLDWKDYCYGYQMNKWREVPTENCYYQDYPVLEQSNGTIHNSTLGNYPAEVPFEQGMSLMPGQSTTFDIMIEVE